jgi:hypothetical protein
LGFDHVGNWTYWADRFRAALRGQLEAQRENPIPVVPLPAPPIGSLAARQKSILRVLSDLDKVMGGPLSGTSSGTAQAGSTPHS